MEQDLFANVGPGRHGGSPIRDTATGTVYPSRNATYRVLAPSLGLDPSDQYGWYTLCRKFPMRFVDVKTGRRIDANGSCYHKEIVMPNSRKRVMDTKTKQIYKGLNLCYKTLLRNGDLEKMKRAGKLADIPEEDNFGYYKMRRFFPGRFIQEDEEGWHE